MNGSGHELLEPAWQMRWRVPELALRLSNQATAHARSCGDGELRLRAEALALFASNRLDHGVAATERALAALGDARRGGHVCSAAEIRVELASCARSAGSTDAALRILEPLLADEQVAPRLRAHALMEFAAAMLLHRTAGECAEALDEAERLYSAECEFGNDTTLLLRARVASARASLYRRHAEHAAASGAAEAGLELLQRLGDAAVDSGEVSGQLALQRIQAQIDLGKQADAIRMAAPVLQRPLRAAAASPVGWLRLALATRVLVPAGEHRAAIHSLTEALAGAERHHLGHLQAEVLSVLSQLHEHCDEYQEALRRLRGAYSADRRWRSAMHDARVRIAEHFPAAEHFPTAERSPTAEHFPTAEAHSLSGVQAPAASSRRRGQDDDVRREARELMATLMAGSAAPADGNHADGNLPDGNHADGQPQPPRAQSGGRQAGGRRRAEDQRPAEPAAAPVAAEPLAAAAQTPATQTTATQAESQADEVGTPEVTAIIPVIPGLGRSEAPAPEVDSFPQQAAEPEHDAPISGPDTEAEAESSPSRRSQGRSLAEIRAALAASIGQADGLGHVTREQDDDPEEPELVDLDDAVFPAPRRRRSRDDEPETSEPETSEPAPTSQPEYEPEPAPAPVAEPEAATAQTGKHRGHLRELPPVQQDIAEALSKDAGIADLLAEALLAYRGGEYQDGQRDGRSATADDSAEQAEPVRRRHAAGESAAESAFSWTPHVY